MFTFIIQTIDLFKLGQVGLFFVFFVLSYLIYAVKLYYSRKDPLAGLVKGAHEKKATRITAIVPVVDEPMSVWRRTMDSLEESLKPFPKSEVIVVFNGKNGVANQEYAKNKGFKVIKLNVASKRKAILEGVREAIKFPSAYTVILDSDTELLPDSIEKLIDVFADKSVGGATPRHYIGGRNGNFWRMISDWLEDIRFEEVVRGQSYFGSVSCLPGRLLAVRTQLLFEIAQDLVEQTFLGKECISGDDRYITSELLRRGYKTVFVPESRVITEAPDTFSGFAKQRTRWSRTSLRESIRSLSWTFEYPYMTFTVLSTIFMRWFFFIVILTAILAFTGVIHRVHAVDLPALLIVLGTALGFLVSGLIRQLRHVLRYPQDILYLPAFLLISTFVLTPIEWYGNLTIRESHWMTRNTN